MNVEINISLYNKKLKEYLNVYLRVGGMPRIVSDYYDPNLSLISQQSQYGHDGDA